MLAARAAVATRLARLAAAAAALALLATNACRLQEITTAAPADAVVAEVYLWAGRQQQFVFLHGTLFGDSVTRPVTGARIEIRDSIGRVLTFEEANLIRCVEDAGSPGAGGTCYASRFAAEPQIQAGERYTLSIELPGGGRLTGSTRVPGDFAVVRPREAAICGLPAETSFEVAWTRSSGAWVYVSEISVRGLRAALAPRGIEVPEDPLRLFGLSIGGADTTIMFPTEYGVFDRFVLERDLALAIAAGLPAEVQVSVIVAAADRNYVNWARGGNFNPSGLLRVPSVEGAGTGVFASLNARSFGIRVPERSTLPDCRQ